MYSLESEAAISDLLKRLDVQTCFLYALANSLQDYSDFLYEFVE